MSPLAVTRLGDGRHAAVLLHGVGGGRTIWGPEGSNTTTALAQAGYTALAVDLPGYGDSPRRPSLSLAVMAEAVCELLDTMDITEAIWIGHSMGGMVAQVAVAHHPSRVSALVLACTSPAFGKPDGAWQQGFVKDRLAPLDAGLGMTHVAHQLVPGLVAPGAPAIVMARASQLMAAVPEITYRQAIASLVGFDGRSALPHIQGPVLCLAGALDTTSPPEVLRRMAQRIPGGVYQCLSEAGHIANLEQPEAFNQAVIEFLRTHAPP